MFLDGREETQLDQAKDELQKSSQREPSDMDADSDGVVLAKTSSFDKLVAYPDIIDPDEADVTKIDREALEEGAEQVKVPDELPVLPLRVPRP